MALGHAGSTMPLGQEGWGDEWPWVGFIHMLIQSPVCTQPGEAGTGRNWESVGGQGGRRAPSPAEGSSEKSGLQACPDPVFTCTLTKDKLFTVFPFPPPPPPPSGRVTNINAELQVMYQSGENQRWFLIHCQVSGQCKGLLRIW